MNVCTGGSRDVEAIGESETRKDADVEANAFKPLRTGVYVSNEVMVGVDGVVVVGVDGGVRR